jgi:hypothetical protein
MNKNAEQLIEIWFRLAQGEKLIGDLQKNIEAYFKFMALWVAFNAFYSNKYKDCDGDRNQALEFAQDKKREIFHSEHLELGEYDKAMAIFLDDSMAIHDKNGVEKTIVDKTKFTQVMEYIYQIRCNLFHGRKPICNNGDVRIVEAAYYILFAHFESALAECKIDYKPV